MSDDDELEQSPPKLTHRPPNGVARPKAVKKVDIDEQEVEEGSDDPMFQPLRRAID